MPKKNDPKNLKKAVDKITTKIEENNYCDITLKVHNGKIKNVTTQIKEKL
ncbi:MAG: hypothetical protein ACQEQF_07070 [Bacillota bacterium]